MMPHPRSLGFQDAARAALAGFKTPLIAAREVLQKASDEDKAPVKINVKNQVDHIHAYISTVWWSNRLWEQVCAQVLEIPTLVKNADDECAKFKAACRAGQLG